MKYRIKTWEELLEVGELITNNFTGISTIISREGGFGFNHYQKYICGKELKTNKRQLVEGFMIEPWMITEIEQDVLQVLSAIVDFNLAVQKEQREQEKLTSEKSEMELIVNALIEHIDARFDALEEKIKQNYKG